MAFTVINSPELSNVIYTQEFYSVWVKPYWGASWRHVPYLFPEQSTYSAAPSDSEATYSWEYGKYISMWGDPGNTLLPLNIENWIIKTVVHTIYGGYISWLGVVVGESLIEEGIDPLTGSPRGVQTLECRGLEYLLERRHVLGAFVGTKDVAAYMPASRDFNLSNSRKESVVGNRSLAKNTVADAYLFSADGAKWSNKNIAEYLLAAFQPWYPVELYHGVQPTNHPEIAYAPMFYIVGQTSALDSIYQEHRMHGRTVREALNLLIDRKRGLGWRIATDGDGPIYIVVYSLSQYPVYGLGAYLPANPRQGDIYINNDPHIQAQYRISSLSQVDQIVVESDQPIMSAVTLGFDDGSLEPAWDYRLDSELTSEDYTYVNDAQLMLDSFSAWDTGEGDFLGLPDGLISYIEFAAKYPPPLVVPDAEFASLDMDGDGYISKDDLNNYLFDVSYSSATEEDRATDKYGAVYSHFQVPKNFDWNGWVPGVYNDGRIELSANGAYWNHDLRFERYLPFTEAGLLENSEQELMEPFAVFGIPNRDRDFLLALADANLAPYVDLEAAQDVDSTITQSEFDKYKNGSGVIGWTEIEAGIAANPWKYVQHDKTQQFDYPACSLRMSDTGLKIIIKSRANHVFANNHLSSIDSKVAPVFDYLDMFVTVFFKTDEMQRVIIPVWNNITNETGQDTSMAREIYIEVPGKECWIAAPGVVTGLDNGALVLHNNGAASILRDDGADLRFIALLAYVWYGQQRASLTLAIQNNLPWFTPGDLVRSTISGASFERIGTAVTSISHNYQEGTQVVTTGYAEMDPVALGDIL